MPFHKITFNDKHRFATVYNYGCTFRCPVCSYKLRSGADGKPGRSFPPPEIFLARAEIEAALRSVRPEKVFFMGGEPTLDPALPELLAFAKHELGAQTFLGHTNGSRLPLPALDGANVGLKAWDEHIHCAYTGQERGRIHANFAAAFRAGLQLKANVVFIPGFVDVDQIEDLAIWLASLSPALPFHVMGYIPVPGQPFARPTVEQMDTACATAARHLKHVQRSHLTTAEALDLSARDDRFASRRIA